MAISIVDFCQGGNFHPLEKLGTYGDRVAVQFCKIQFDSSYVTGGEAIDFPAFTEVLDVWVWPGAIYNFIYIPTGSSDPNGGLLKGYVMNTGSEIANGTNLAAVVPYAMVIGLR